MKNHYYGHCYSWNSWCLGYYDDSNSFWSDTIPVGAFILSVEIAGWSMFYASYKDAIKYGEYLIEANKEALTTDASF